jgi:hypothetical protein
MTEMTGRSAWLLSGELLAHCTSSFMLLLLLLLSTYNAYTCAVSLGSLALSLQCFWCCAPVGHVSYHVPKTRCSIHQLLNLPGALTQTVAILLCIRRVGMLSGCPACLSFC